MFGVTVKHLPAAEAQGARTFSVMTQAKCGHCGKSLNATEERQDICDKCYVHNYNAPVADEKHDE